MVGHGVDGHVVDGHQAGRLEAIAAVDVEREALEVLNQVRLKRRERRRLARDRGGEPRDGLGRFALGAHVPVQVIDQPAR